MTDAAIWEDSVSESTAWETTLYALTADYNLLTSLERASGERELSASCYRVTSPRTDDITTVSVLGG